MDNSKNAILFYGKNKTPLLFLKYKFYDAGTGYVALYDNVDDCCILCRLLDEQEIPSFVSNTHRLVLKSDDKDCENKVLKEYSVIIIKSDLNSIEETDNIINNYRCAF